MSEPIVMHALKDKRSHIAGLIESYHLKIKRLRVELETIDAAIVVFDPDAKPRYLNPKRPTGKQSPYFVSRELPRLVMGILRNAEGPLSAREIALDIMAEKKIPTDRTQTVRGVVSQVRSVVRNMLKKGAAQGIKEKREMKWITAK